MTAKRTIIFLVVLALALFFVFYRSDPLLQKSNSEVPDVKLSAEQPPEVDVKLPAEQPPEVNKHSDRLSGQAPTRDQTVVTNHATRSGLDSDDEITKLRAIYSAAERGLESTDCEAKIAALMTDSWRGKRFSRWCFYALCKICKNPDKYRRQYIRSAGWILQSTIRIERETGRSGPDLPEDLRTASKVTWDFCLDHLLPLLKTMDKQQYSEARMCLERLDAPPEIIVPKLERIVFSKVIELHPDATMRGRVAAAELIGHYGNNVTSFDILVNYMNDSDWEIRAACALSMGLISRPYDLYGDWQGELKHPNKEKALALLLVALRDRDRRVRSSAAKGMKAMGVATSENVAEIVAQFQKEINPGEKANLADALGHMEAPEAVKGLVLGLSDPDKSVRASSAIGLMEYARNMRKDQIALKNAATLAVPALIRVLKDEHTVSWNAVSALGEFKGYSHSAVDDILDLFRSEKKEFSKSHYISTLGKIGPASEKALPEIAPLANKAVFHDCLAVALGNIGKDTPEVESALLAILQSGRNWARCQAAYSLGKVGSQSPVVIKTLEKLLQEEKDPNVQDGARQGLMLLNRKPEKPPEPPTGQF